MSIEIIWFPPSWFQIKTKNKIIHIDPAYLKKHHANYPKKIEYSNWPDPIDGLPENDLEKADHPGNTSPQRSLQERDSKQT